MMKYMLERAEPIIIKTELTKNRTCQSYRWKQIAMSDDLELLKNYLGPYCRIIDRDCRVIEKHERQY